MKNEKKNQLKHKIFKDDENINNYKHDCCAQWTMLVNIPDGKEATLLVKRTTQKRDGRRNTIFSIPNKKIIFEVEIHSFKFINDQQIHAKLVLIKRIIEIWWILICLGNACFHKWHPFATKVKSWMISLASEAANWFKLNSYPSERAFASNSAIAPCVQWLPTTTPLTVKEGEVNFVN